LLIAVASIILLLVASPALSRILVPPRTDFFTEFWMLGPNRKAEGYPYNITRNQQYDLYLEVSNHLGHAADYLVMVKFRNQTQPGPGNLSNMPSSLPAVFNITAFVEDQQTAELLLTFSFDYEYDSSRSVVTVRGLRLNDSVKTLQEYIYVSAADGTRYTGHLFFELWVRNSTTGDPQYHQRYVSLLMNMTAP